MQRIFIVREELVSNIDMEGNFEKVNKFIRENGKILSVTSQIVSSGSDDISQRGRWLIVADDGKSLQL